MTEKRFTLDEKGVRELQGMQRRIAALESEIGRAGRARKRRPPLQSRVLARTDAEIAKGGTGTISVWSPDSTGTLVDSGENLTGVRTRMAAIPINKWVYAERWPWGWEIYAAEC